MSTAAAQLDAISCTPDHECVAVDADTGTKPSGLYSGGRAVAYIDGQWQPPVQIDSGHALTDISCATSATCVAVDSYGRAITLHDGTWSAPQPVVARGRRPARRLRRRLLPDRDLLRRRRPLHLRVARRHLAPDHRPAARDGRRLPGCRLLRLRRHATASGSAPAARSSPSCTTRARTSAGSSPVPTGISASSTGRSPSRTAARISSRTRSQMDHYGGSATTKCCLRPRSVLRRTVLRRVLWLRRVHGPGVLDIPVLVLHSVVVEHGLAAS